MDCLFFSSKSKHYWLYLLVPTMLYSWELLVPPIDSKVWDPRSALQHSLHSLSLSHHQLWKHKVSTSILSSLFPTSPAKSKTHVEDSIHMYCTHWNSSLMQAISFGSNNSASVICHIVWRRGANQCHHSLLMTMSHKCCFSVAEMMSFSL